MKRINVILTAELLNNQALSDRALSAAISELYYGFDLRSRLEEFYRQVKPQDVLRVGRKYLGGPYVTIVTTPEADFSQKLQNSGSKD